MEPKYEVNADRENRGRLWGERWCDDILITVQYVCEVKTWGLIRMGVLRMREEDVRMRRWALQLRKLKAAKTLECLSRYSCGTTAIRRRVSLCQVGS